jgi:5-methylcytosine-specific restriction endonuclease McrA
VWKRTAETVEIDHGFVLRSPNFVFEVPSVIRLVEYIDIRRRRRESGRARSRIFARDKYRCQYCGQKGTAFTLTLDHIVPRARGGASEPSNMCTACQPCNQRKGDRTPDEARMPLLATPSALRYGLDKAMLQHHAQSRPEWRKYLFLDEEAGVA